MPLPKLVAVAWCLLASLAVGRHVRSRHGHGSSHTAITTTTSSPTLRVVLAADTSNVKYVALLPLTCFVWRHRFNAHPLVFLVSDGGPPPPLARVVTKWILAAGAQVETVTPPRHHSDVTFAQIVRLAAFASRHVAATDLVVTADADTWPLSQAFWRAHTQASRFALDGSVTVVNGDYFRERAGTSDRVAISYIIATATTWRHVVTQALTSSACNVNTPTSVATCILDAGVRHYGMPRWRTHPARKEDDVQWTWDQTFMTAALAQAAARHELRLRLGRGVKAGRLDRKAWAYGGNPEVHPDAHLPAPVTDAAVWHKLRDVWKTLFPADVGWVDAYKAAVVQGATESGRVGF